MVEIPARLSDMFMRTDGATIFYPFGAARGGYVVVTDDRLRQLLAVAWTQVPTTREWVLRFFAYLLVAPFLLLGLGALPWPVVLALFAATWIGAIGWSVYRFRTRVAPLIRDLPRAPAREASVWTPIARSFPWSLTIFGFLFMAFLTVTSARGPLEGVVIFAAVTAAFGVTLAAKILYRTRSPR